MARVKIPQSAVLLEGMSPSFAVFYSAADLFQLRAAANAVGHIFGRLCCSIELVEELRLFFFGAVQNKVKNVK